MYEFVSDQIKRLNESESNTLVGRLNLKPEVENPIDHIILKCKEGKYLNEVVDILNDILSTDLDKKFEESFEKDYSDGLKAKNGSQSGTSQSYEHEKKLNTSSPDKWENKLIDDKDDPPSSIKSVLFYLTFLVAIVAIIYTCAVMKPQNEDIFPLEHYYLTPEVFQSKLDDMTKRFPNQEEMFWLKIRKLGYKHLKRVFKIDKSDLQPFTILVAGYNGTELTMNCFLKELGSAFTEKEYKFLFSKGVDKLSLDSEIRKSLKTLQKYVVVQNIEQMNFDAASIFMNYADEHIDSEVISFPQSTIIMTAEMPFFFNETNYDRLKDEEKVMKHFVNEIWSHDKNKASALWSRIGNVVILLKPESTKECK